MSSRQDNIIYAILQSDLLREWEIFICLSKQDGKVVVVQATAAKSVFENISQQ